MRCSNRRRTRASRTPLNAGDVLRGRVPIYGTVDAGRKLCLRLVDVTKEAGLRYSRVFPAVYFAVDSTGDLVALLCTHVDDLLLASTPEGDRIIQHVLDAFRIGKVEEGTFRFCGREYVQPPDFYHHRECPGQH